MSSPAPLDPARLLRTLAEHEVAFVLIGAMAARLQGFPRLTADADITPSQTRDNLERLAAALRALKTKVFTEAVPEGLPFDCSAQQLARATTWNLTTAAGRLDIAFEPSGTDGFDDLAANAVEFEAFGVRFQVARLEDIARSKRASDRPQDRQDVVLIEEMLREAGREDE